MTPLPTPIAISLVFGVCGLATLALLYWDKQPEKAQWAVRKGLKFILRVLGWAAMMVCIPGLFIIAIVPAMLFITLRAIQCKPAKVNIKLT